MNIAYIPLLFGIFLNATAQLLLKAGMERIGYFDFSVRNLWPIGLRVAENPYIVVGLGCYVLSVGAWLMALSRVDVSVAYPLVSLGYIFTAATAYLFLHESLSPMRIVGIVVILVGVVLVTRS